MARADFDEVVNVELKRRAERFEQLKKIGDRYSDLLRQKRETMRKLSESSGNGDPPTETEGREIARLAGDLRSRRVQLCLERAEVETLLERRKKADGASGSPNRSEVPQLEDRLAVLDAKQKVVDEELERLGHRRRAVGTWALEVEELRAEIAQIEASATKIGAEVEALNVEREAPPRIRLIDEASPARP